LESGFRGRRTHYRATTCGRHPCRPEPLVGPPGKLRAGQVLLALQMHRLHPPRSEGTSLKLAPTPLPPKPPLKLHLKAISEETQRYMRPQKSRRAKLGASLYPGLGPVLEAVSKLGQLWLEWRYEGV